jgi:protein archease
MVEKPSDPTGRVGEGPRPPAGHRRSLQDRDCFIEAWGPDRVTCITEALRALVEEFAEVPDPVTTDVLPLAAGPGEGEDALVSLIEEVIYALDVFSVVPVRFHLAETEDRGIAGDMEVVPVEHASLVGPLPRAVSYRGLTMAEHPDGWWCRVPIEV